MSPTRLTIIAEILLLPPVGLLVLFAFGEGPGGLQHVLEVIPLLLLAAAAWRWPQAAGYGLAGIGLVLAVMYPVLFGSFPLATILTVEAVLFVPPLLAGALLLLAARPGLRRSAREEPRDQ